MEQNNNKLDILHNIIYDSLKNHNSVTDEEKNNIIKMINLYYTPNNEVNELITKTWDSASTVGLNSVSVRNGRKCNGITKMFYIRKIYLQKNLK